MESGRNTSKKKNWMWTYWVLPNIGYCSNRHDRLFEVYKGSGMSFVTFSKVRSRGKSFTVYYCSRTVNVRQSTMTVQSSSLTYIF